MLYFILLLINYLINKQIDYIVLKSDWVLADKI